MSRDRLGSLQKCSQRWGSKQYMHMRKRCSTTTIARLTDVSEDSLRVLKQVEIIRDTIGRIEKDLPAVRTSLRRLLAAVNEEDKQNVQDRLIELSETAKRAQLLLVSMDSFCKQEHPDSTLVRIVKTQQMKLSYNLMKIIEELRGCLEVLTTLARKQQSRSNFFGIVTDCIVLPLHCQLRSKSSPMRLSTSCPELRKKLEEGEVVQCMAPRRDHLKEVEIQLAKVQKLAATVADLVSDHNEFNNIEFNVIAHKCFLLHLSRETRCLSTSELVS